MLMMPMGILPFWISTLLSIGLLGGSIYLGWAWEEGVVVGVAWLYTAVAMAVVSFFGRSIVLLFFGSSRSDAAPDGVRDGRVHKIERPDGTTLHVEEYGLANGPTIVFTHGWGLDSTEWCYAKRQFAASFRMIVWDLPGLGLSGRPTISDWSMEKLAADLEAVTALAGKDPVVLMGHSIGGMITLTFCRLFPQHLGSRVWGLVLENTTYTNPVVTARWGGFLRAIQKPILEPLSWLMIVLGPLVWLSNWMNYLNGMAHLGLHVTQFGRKETKKQLEFMTRYTLTAPPDVLGHGMFGMFRYDATEVLSKIPIPVLINTGDRDHLCVDKASAFMKAQIPQSTLREYKPTGHLTLIEQHEAVDMAVAEFALNCLAMPPLASKRSNIETEAPALKYATG